MRKLRPTILKQARVLEGYKQGRLPAYDGGEAQAGSKNVDRLRELLDDVAPDEADDPEEDDDDAGEVFGAGLTDEVLK